MASKAFHLTGPDECSSGGPLSLSWDDVDTNTHHIWFSMKCSPASLPEIVWSAPFRIGDVDPADTPHTFILNSLPQSWYESPKLTCVLDAKK